MTSIDLYTDASYAQHKAPKHFGIGMFMIDYADDEKEYQHGQRVQFAHITNKIKQKYQHKIKGNLTLFELHAIVEGIRWTIKQTNKRESIEEIRIYTDSLNVVECYHGLVEHPMFTGYTKSLKHQIEGIEKTNNLKITLSHIKAHCGVYGNTKADKLAKKRN